MSPADVIVAVLLIAAAACFIFASVLGDLFERSHGMAPDPHELFPDLAEAEAIAKRIHALMVADGLIRDPNTHSRLGETA